MVFIGNKDCVVTGTILIQFFLLICILCSIRQGRLEFSGDNSTSYPLIFIYRNGSITTIFQSSSRRLFGKLFHSNKPQQSLCMKRNSTAEMPLRWLLCVSHNNFRAIHKWLSIETYQRVRSKLLESRVQNDVHHLSIEKYQIADDHQSERLL